jgi:TRAP-type mannitol/chloroaromatic compound transport system permease small subunit
MWIQFLGGVTRLNRWVGRWVSLGVLLIFGLLLADVVMRYLVGRPATWTAEFATLVFGVYAIIGGGYLLSNRGHVNVDILYGNFSVRRKAAVDVATFFLFALFVGILLWQSLSLAAEAVEGWERSNSVWKPYIWPVKCMIPVSAVLLLLQGIVRLTADIRTLLGLPVDPEIFGTLPTPISQPENETSQ